MPTRVLNGVNKKRTKNVAAHGIPPSVTTGHGPSISASSAFKYWKPTMYEITPAITANETIHGSPVSFKTPHAIPQTKATTCFNQ